MAVRAFAVFLGVIGVCAAACASGSDGGTPTSSSSSSSSGGTIIPTGDDDGTTPAAPPSDQQPCPTSPCTARPIIFIHGHTGTISDAKTILDDLVKPGERFEKSTPVGVQDHQAWGAKSIPRKQWLFAFDYYLNHGTEQELTYTSGPGRIGTDQSFSCPNPTGPGHIRATSVYDNNTTHEYAKDLSDLIDSVLRATGAPKVDIITHSMGGLITRSYITYLGGNAKIDQVMFLATPHLGVSFASTETAFNNEAQPWMTDHELAELERQSSFAQTQFTLCGQTTNDTWPNLLLAGEGQVTSLPTYHCMRGDQDPIVDEASAKHPKCVDYQEVQGADHVGLPLSQDASDTTRRLIGGFVTVSTQL